ncbi:hypothetical protein [Enterococcus diestrammenae]|uniref:hypothetical protein n=1 Tax=Enterococcus diestrammenae TaxID=1155073 RepID=UPI001955F98A
MFTLKDKIKRYLVVVFFVCIILVPIILETRGTITTELMTILLGIAFVIASLLILVLKQDYLLTFISINGSSRNSSRGRLIKICGFIFLATGIALISIGIL